MPMPVCQAGTTTFDSLDGIISYDDYLGNSSAAQWSYVGEALLVDGNVRLTMRNGTTGTTMSSSIYVWYGRVDVVMKTSHLAGVVSDAILLSNAKDEIDFEFIGTELEDAQTNYYYEGIDNYTNMVEEPVSNSTYDNFHTYSVDWTENNITWYVDGTSVRTLTKESTYNSSTDQYMFPQTPARIQLGIWPGGASSEPEGTIEWAGGAINWNAADLTDPGYYFVELQSVTVTCYDAPSGTNSTGSTSYIYTSKDAQSADIAITDDTTVEGNSDGTGLDPSPGSDSGSDAASTTIDIATTIGGSVTTVAVVSEVAASAQVISGDSAEATTLATATSATITSSGSSSGSTGFLQGDTSPSSSSSSSSSSVSTGTSDGSNVAVSSLWMGLAFLLSVSLSL
jgi:beta-glucanase (GH16 family)